MAKPRQPLQFHAVDPLEMLVQNGWQPDPEKLVNAGIDQYQYSHMRRIGKKNFDAAGIAKRVRAGAKVKETGGATEVFVKAYPSVLLGVAMGRARCSDDDKYDRRFGEHLALARAINKIADQYEKRAAQLRGLLV